MNKYTPTLLPNILEVVKNIVQNTRDVLCGGILQPKCLVNKVLFEILWTNEPNTIEHVRYPVLSQELVVLGHRVATQVYVFGDSGTFFVEEGQFVPLELEILVGVGGTTSWCLWKWPNTEIIRSSAGPFLSATLDD